MKLEIVDNEADTIRKMFELYSKGLSLKRIAYQLNSDGVRSPQPQKGRVLQIVSNELFASVERRFETTKRLWGVGGTGLARGQQNCSAAENAGEVSRWLAVALRLRVLSTGVRFTRSEEIAFARTVCEFSAGRSRKSCSLACRRRFSEKNSSIM